MLRSLQKILESQGTYIGLSIVILTRWCNASRGSSKEKDESSWVENFHVDATKFK